MRRVIVLLAVPALIAVGCGEDDGDSNEESSAETVSVGSTADEEPLSRAEYIEQADAICQRLQAQRERLSADVEIGATGSEADRAADSLEQSAQITEDRFDEIKALPAPVADREVLSQMFDLAYENIALVQSAAQSIRYGQSSGVEALNTEGSQNATQFNSLARDYGFRVCGQDD